MNDQSSIYQRDERGLVKGVDYVYNPDSTVNWRRMIVPEFLGVKRECEAELVKKHGKPIKEIDKTQLEDHYLLLLLGGIKRLASLRGYDSLTRKVDHVSDGKCVVTCKIRFIGNYETEMRPVVYSDVASATYANTSGEIGQMFLETTAANRALVRAVRGFLNINIVGFDEMGPGKVAVPLVTEATEGSSPPIGFQAKDKFAQRCQELRLTFDQVKQASLAYAAELKTNPTEWKSFDDIPPLDSWCLWGKLEEKKTSAITKEKAKK